MPHGTVLGLAAEPPSGPELSLFAPRGELVALEEACRGVLLLLLPALFLGLPPPVPDLAAAIDSGATSARSCAAT
ncbi:unnamed protein product [Ectocarpus sp. CCAP 1310/34]|nr:unnamed protein product [Ectocarpus sp. CCAP 1310/34]